MAQEQNGKSAIWAILQAVTLALLGWLSIGMVQAKQDVAVLQANYTYIQSTLIEIKSALKIP